MINISATGLHLLSAGGPTAFKAYHIIPVISIISYKSLGTTRRTRFLPPAFFALSGAITFFFLYSIAFLISVKFALVRTRLPIV